MRVVVILSLARRDLDVDGISGAGGTQLTGGGLVTLRPSCGLTADCWSRGGE
jgi:hypothetical protein